MEQALNQEPTAEEADTLQAQIQRTLSEIEHLRRQMQSDQAAIERSRSRTRAMLADLSSLLKAA